MGGLGFPFINSSIFGCLAMLCASFLITKKTENRGPLMSKLYSVQETAKTLGLTAKWVRRLGPELIAAGHAQKVGKVLVCFASAVDYIKNRPDGRGRPKKCQPK